MILHWDILFVITEIVIAWVFSRVLKMSLEGTDIQRSLLPLSKLYLLRSGWHRRDLSRMRDILFLFFLGSHRNKLLKSLVVVSLIAHSWLQVSKKISLAEEHMLPVHLAPEDFLPWILVSPQCFTLAPNNVKLQLLLGQNMFFEVRAVDLFVWMHVHRNESEFV